MKPAINFRLSRPVSLIITGLFMAMILYTSTKPTPKVDVIDQTLFDRILDLAHVPMYALLTFLLMLALSSFSLRRQAAAFMVAVGFGVLNEIVQIATPGRSCSLHDILDNALGALFAILCVNFFIYQAKKTAV